jgi:hypothetical protein
MNHRQDALTTRPRNNGHAPDRRSRLTNPGALTTIRVFHGLGVQGINPAVYGEVGVAQGRRRL